MEDFVWQHQSDDDDEVDAEPDGIDSAMAIIMQANQRYERGREANEREEYLANEERSRMELLRERDGTPQARERRRLVRARR